MNKVYRVIWSAAQQCWMVVSELTTSQKKQKSCVNKKKLASLSVGVFAMLLGSSGYAADYTSTITGDFTFPAGETSTVTTTADSTPGIYVEYEKTILSNDDLVINTAGRLSHGIEVAGYDDNLTAMNLKNANITTSGSGASGMMVSGNLTSTGLVTIRTSGSQSYGIRAALDGNVHLADVDITIDDNSSALYASSDNSHISVAGTTTIHLEGSASNGVYSRNQSSSISLANLTLTSSGDANRGIFVFDSTVDITGKMVMRASQQYSGYIDGVYATNAGVVHLADTDLDITGDRSTGMNANGTGSSISSSGLTTVKIAGNNSAGLQAQSGGVINVVNTNVTTSGDSTEGLLATGVGSTITSTGATTVQTTGNNSSALQASNGGKIHMSSTTNVNTSGSGSSAIYASGTGSIIDLTAATTVATTGDGAHGIQQDGATQINTNGGSVSTSGAGSHGFTATGAASKTFDGSVGNILPTITVTGAGSAMLDANGAGSQITLNNQALDIRGAASVNTWGAKSEAGGKVTFNGGSTGGTGLWATGNGSTVALAGNVDSAGSRVKLDNSAVLNIDTPNANIGSLEGDATSRVNLTTAGNPLTIGSNNAAGNGSLVDNANYAGGLAGIGQLNKTGLLTQILSGTGNTVGSVDVTGGTLRFEQAGAFTTTGDYTTQAGATTDIGKANSSLVVGGVFTQEKNSALNVTLGASPDITADTAKLNGSITVNGFATSSAGPVKASEVTNNTYMLMHTANGISGDFVNNPLTTSGLDYLLYDGYLSADRKDYNLGGFRLAWNQGLTAKSTGNFTVNGGTAFNVDTVLADQTVPPGGFASGWDGKSLTKAGEGLLVLSAVNTYTGKTTLSAGTLRTDTADSIASSNELNINGGVFDLNGNNQRVNRLNGSGGTVQLNGGMLTANNAASTDNTTFTGDIVDGNQKSSLTKTGAGALTLSGKTGWTGDTFIDGGELVLDGSNGGGQLVSNIIAKDNTALSLRNGASLTGWIDPTDVNIDTTSRWNMTADSLVDNVNLAGIINFSAPSTQPMSAGHTLTANNWHGQNGTVVLNTLLGNDISATDKIVVNGNTSGNTFVKVNNAGGAGAQTVEGIRIVEVKGTSDGTFEKSGRIVAGAYDYDIVKKGADWYLSSLYIVRPESASYTANLAAANTMFTTRLHDRLGETQYIDLLTGEKKVTSMWLRQVGGHNGWKDSSGQLSTQGNRYVTQLGGDIAQWSSDGLQRLHLGVMAGYGNNSSNSHSNKTGYRSEGSVSGYSAGLYATWYQNDETKQGVYVDSWAQYGWFNNDVKGQDVQNESYKSSGMTASLEAGYTHKLGEFHGSAGSLQEWFIQPQAQAIWMGVQADDHRESNGTHVSGEGDGNLQTRLGVRTYLKGHNKIDDGKNRTFQPFVEANWIHNTQDFGTRMDGVSVSQNGARNIGEVKTGLEGQLNARLSVWGNVGVQIGDKGYNDTSAMLGAKYSF